MLLKIMIDLLFELFIYLKHLFLKFFENILK